MSDVAFENFTKQVLELSYEQTLTLMEKMLESLKTKKMKKIIRKWNKSKFCNTINIFGGPQNANQFNRNFRS